MRRILIVIGILVVSNFFAQKTSKDYTFFDKSNGHESNGQPQSTPSEPGDPPPAPIGDYIPVLGLVGIGMIIYFNKKKCIFEK